ncbi:MAG: 3-isopropylmalate dehydratase [Desulfitibacter sp. BRH_c19]|nr:MAG: 3-isopropylmalate dehydratase [Desulfitibacter sp. BRH_c19]
MSSKFNFSGRVWLFGDNVDTDQILPGYAMAVPREKLKNYVMAGSKQGNFAQLVRPGDIIVAGENFGSGSSREQAPVALKEAGVALVIAKSFARIFRRNSINIGLPVMLCNLLLDVQEEDIINVDLKEAKVEVTRDGAVVYGEKLSESSLETLDAGGLINKVRKQFGIV